MDQHLVLFYHGKSSNELLTLSSDLIVNQLFSNLFFLGCIVVQKFAGLLSNNNWCEVFLNDDLADFDLVVLVFVFLDLVFVNQFVRVFFIVVFQDDTATDITLFIFIRLILESRILLLKFLFTRIDASTFLVHV